MVKCILHSQTMFKVCYQQAETVAVEPVRPQLGAKYLWNNSTVWEGCL